VQLARDAGALNVLPMALSYRPGVAALAGEFAAAAEMIDEADAISRATGRAPLPYISVLLAAWHGDESQALEIIRDCREDAMRRGEGRAITLSEYATALLYNGLGRYGAAFTAAERAAEHDDVGLCCLALFETVEAATRIGNRDAAASALERLEERGGASGSDWAHGEAARSRGRCSPTARRPKSSTARPSIDLSEPRSRSNSPDPAWSSANGYAASTGTSTHVSNCALPLTYSAGSVPVHSPSVPAMSCSPWERRSASTSFGRSRISLRRNCTSPASPATA
jgi:hypothetical protein